MTDRPDGRAGHGEPGFTLMEVLIAFAILSVSMGALMLAFSDGLRMTGRSVTISTATLQAQSLLDAVGRSIPVRQGQVTGVLEDGSHWNVSIEPFDTGESGSAATASLLAFRVDATVEWERDRGVTLSTLRLASGDE